MNPELQRHVQVSLTAPSGSEGSTVIDIDIKENEINSLSPELLQTLLIDHTTGRNIFWGSDHYAHHGKGYQYHDEITVGAITGDNGMVIMPRVLKTLKEQRQRSREMA